MKGVDLVTVYWKAGLCESKTESREHGALGVGQVVVGGGGGDGGWDNMRPEGRACRGCEMSWEIVHRVE